MKIKRLQKTAMPARLGEIDGIVHPMPILLSDEAISEHPVFDLLKTKKLVANDLFLNFVFSELGGGDHALRQIFSTFVLEDDQYCKKYKEG
jgi:hypothetical protein